jgi:hypothetical protein
MQAERDDAKAAEAMHARLCKSGMARIAVAVAGALCTVGWAAPAAAYRPFDGTDAAVADPGEVEIEFQPVGFSRAGTQNFMSGPNAVFNYGFADRWELVLQGTVQPAPESAGPNSVPNAALVKYVLQPGVLQGKPGPSVAMEFGALLPDAADTAAGLSWTGIISQRWQWGTVHLNFEADLTPDQHAEAFFDAIIEGPSQWSVRPVMEIYSDSVFSQTQTFSALVGAIWQVRNNLAFDIGLRYASVNGRPVDELRAGFTVGFPVSLSRPIGSGSALSSSLLPR